MRGLLFGSIILSMLVACAQSSFYMSGAPAEVDEAYDASDVALILNISIAW
jgi:hypothetical protein